MYNQLNENLTIEQRLMDVIYLEVLNIPTVISLSCLKQKSQIISSCY